MIVPNYEDESSELTLVKLGRTLIVGRRPNRDGSYSKRIALGEMSGNTYHHIGWFRDAEAANLFTQLMLDLGRIR